jgi:hypothetical protein
MAALMIHMPPRSARSYGGMKLDRLKTNAVIALSAQNQLKPLAEAMTAIDPAITLVTPDPALLDPALVGDDATEDALLDFVSDNYLHAHHWYGTCKMAPYEFGGVVDTRGRVYKTQNLYVADASIMPFKVRRWLAPGLDDGWMGGVGGGHFRRCKVTCR